MDQSLLLLTSVIKPENLFGVHIPGMGVLLSLLILVATGLITANFVGQRLAAAVLERRCSAAYRW